MSLTANGRPSYQANASPIGVAAAVFRGGNFNDAFAGPTPAAFLSPESFTVVAVFNPSGNGESAAGSRFEDKSQIVSANTHGNGNGWGLGYADNSVWFGVGDPARGPATLQLPAGTAMTGRWWIAIATWTADDGSGSPAFAMWLYDEKGNEVARHAPTDPNAIAGIQGAFSNPRSNTGIAIGADRAAVTTRNFAGQIITTRLYPIHAHRILASGLADQIAREHTTEVLPE